ncbi:MAG: LSU ribosomal protein L2p (L8e), partial [uncultured Solirubrobacteraceae bacterium]
GHPQAQADQRRDALRQLPRLRRDHEEDAREDARGGAHEVRWAQRQRPQDRPPPRRRGQAALPHDRLQAPSGRHPRQGGRDRIRPQPHGVHRLAALRRRRQGLHPRPGAAARRRDGRLRARLGHRRGQLPAAGQHADRHRGAQRGAAARPRGPARPLRRNLDPAHGQGRRHGHPPAPVGRDAPGARGVPRHRGNHRQRRPPERQDRQGGPQTSHGCPPADARHRHEPRRPPARRRRGLDDRGPSPRHAVGRPDARVSHAEEEQVLRPLHRARPPARKGQAL